MTVTTPTGDAARLVRRYYLYAGIYTLAASVIWGINTLFLLDAGLSITEVFVANAAFSVGTVLFEVPTGVVADTVGRRASFLLSLAVLSTTTLLYVWLAQIGAGVVLFSVVSALMGLGFTFYSGAMEAWLVDGLRFRGYDGGLDGIFSKSQMVSGAAMLVGTVGGGLLGQIDLALPFLVRSGLLAALFWLAFRGMHDEGFEATRVALRDVPAEAAAIGRKGVTLGWRYRPLRLLIVAAAIQNGFFFWAWYAWQPYFLEELLDQNLVWVAGVVAAVLAVAMMAGNALVTILSRWCGHRTTLLLWAGAAFALALLGVGAVDEFLPALALLTVAGVAYGVQMPVRQAFLHEVAGSEERATVVSFDSMIGGIGGVGGQVGLGALAERRGYSFGYILGGAVTLIAVPLIWAARRTKAPEDQIVGSHPRPGSACAIELPPSPTHVSAGTTQRTE